MFITEHDDGSVTWTGSFNRAEWDAFLAEKGLSPSDEASVPLGLSAEGEPELLPETPQQAGGEPVAEVEPVEQPAGNASTEEWRDYAIAQGASAEQVADLTRNELRDQFGTEG